ncbi:MAG TPA: glycosyltransferase family 4 protein [Flavobacteriales bacterium]|nr:glycosyltransferase family 4 protein [Flavobacteriales bacterium]
MERIKTILITIESPGFNLNNRYSAVAAVISSFAGMLQEQGYKILVNGQPLEEAAKQQHSSIPSSTGKKNIYRFFPKRVREMIKDLLLFKRLKRLNQQLDSCERPDLIIAWISYAGSHSALLAQKWNIPLVSIYDNPVSEEYKYLFKFYPFFRKKIKRAESEMVKAANALIVYSRAVEEHVKKEYGVTTRCYYKAFTDFKRMSYKQYNRPTNEIRFAYIGSFFNWHKIEDLIDAFVSLKNEGSGGKLVLIGDGPEYERMKKLATDSGYGHAIEFTGRCDSSELENRIAEIHVGIIPNALFWQGPVKLFQYSAAQMPVICKATPTIVELTQKNKGYLYFDTKQELKLQMKYILENPAKAKELGLETQEFAKKHFSEKAYADFFSKIFAELE